jgi:CDP-diacylglycerol--serine O-phosphatidyltransferase
MKILIPNAITLAGAFAALLSMMWAGEFAYWACNALIAAALCDMVDGRVARMLNAQTRFGEQLDSLVDVVSFGVAPAWLVYSWRLTELGTFAGIPLGVFPLFAFVACSASRLALFNSSRQLDDSNFSGIPTPVAALLVVTAVMAWHETGWALFESTGLLVAILLVSAVLMVVPIPFRSFKQFRSVGTRALYFGSIGGGLLLLVFQLPGGAVLFALMILYILQGLGSALLGGHGLGKST